MLEESSSTTKEPVKMNVFRRSKNYFLGWHNSVKIRTIRDKAKKVLTEKALHEGSRKEDVFLATYI